MICFLLVFDVILYGSAKVSNAVAHEGREVSYLRLLLRVNVMHAVYCLNFLSIPEPISEEANLSLCNLPFPVIDIPIKVVKLEEAAYVEVVSVIRKLTAAELQGRRHIHMVLCRHLYRQTHGQHSIIHQNFV